MLEININGALYEGMSQIESSREEVSLEWLKSPLSVEIEKALSLFGLESLGWSEVMTTLKQRLTESVEESIDSVNIKSGYVKSGRKHYSISSILAMIDEIVTDLEDEVPEYLEVKTDSLVRYIKEEIKYHYDIEVP